MTEFATLAGVAAATAVGYSVVRDHSDSSFDLQNETGSPGANSWPEGWPEEWMESARSEPMFVDGAWFTHKPDYGVKQKIKGAINHSEDIDEPDEDEHGYQTFFPFRIEWDQLKLDLEFADKRLAQEAATLRKEIADFEIRYKKAHEGYTKELVRAKLVRDDAAQLNDGDLETSSDSDPLRSIRQNWVRTRKALKAERAAIENRYSAEAVSYNLRVGKARDVQPGRFWMRNVRIVPLDELPGKKAKPRVKSKVKATLTVAGRKVSDKQHGFVDVQLDWSETHKVRGSYSWKSTMRINAIGEIKPGHGKLWERFTQWGAADLGVNPSKAEGARRLAATGKAHAHGGAFAEIPGVTRRIPTGESHSVSGPDRPFVDEALRLKRDGEPRGLRIKTNEDGTVTYAISRAGGVEPLRIARTGTTTFRITNAKRMNPKLKAIVIKAFRSRGQTVTITD